MDMKINNAQLEVLAEGFHYCDFIKRQVVQWKHTRITK